MGDFSRDTFDKLKHYVGVRLQQGVPLLDADWNEQEDNRKFILESFLKWFIGNGVPVGNDGFRIIGKSYDNDFLIKGGDGTAEKAGRCLVKGLDVIIESTIKYTEQELYTNNDLADEWNVDVLPALTKPPSGNDRTDLVYLDIWEREVDSVEDPDLVNPTIGVETCVRVKREWVVRVAEGKDIEDLPEDNPPHFYYPLALITREADENKIKKDMIEDLRDTQNSIKKEIEIRNSDGNLVYDNEKFLQVLENTRDNVLAFIYSICTEFNDISTPLLSAEIIGLQAAEHIVRTAETGIGLVNSESLGNKGALNFLYQMYNAENNFMEIWQDAVLQLGGTPKKYAAYTNFIQRLDDRLHDQTVGPLTGLLPALEGGYLDAATEMQEEIARLFGPTVSGSIQVYLAKSPPGNLTNGQTARFEFKVKSYTTSSGTYTVSILPVTGWKRTVVDNLGTPIPGGQITIGASGSEETILVDVEVGTGTCNLQLYVESNSNPTEVNRLTGLYVLTEGQAPPVGEDEVQLTINSTYQADQDPNTGIVSIVRGVQGTIEIRVYNNTGQNQTFNLSFEKLNENVFGSWAVEFSGVPQLNIDDDNYKHKVIKITPSNTPGSEAVSMNLRVIAATSGGTVHQGQIVIPLAATT